MIEHKVIIEGIRVKTILVTNPDKCLYGTFKFESDGKTIDFGDYTIDKMNTTGITLVKKSNPKQKVHIAVKFEVKV